MNINSTNLQAAAGNLAANIEEINRLRAQVADNDLKEAAQLMLIDKYDLSQTEASEIVDEIQAGMDLYRSTYSRMEKDRESTLREGLEKAVEGMNDEERVRYLASMLSALQLAAVKADASQEEIDNILDSNLQKNEAELVNGIILSLDTLPLEALSQAAKELNPEAVKGVAEAIDRNGEEYRFIAALQLYMSNREGTFRMEESDQPLSPRMIGSLACGAVDALVATSDLKANKIELSRWQYILKVICGTLFVIASACLAALGMLVLALPVMALVWNLLGTGFFAILLTCLLLVPVMDYASDKAMVVVDRVLEWLSPIYDRFIVATTAFVKSICAKISNWIKGRYHAVAGAMTRNKETEEVAQTEAIEVDAPVEEEEINGVDAPLPA